MENVNTEDSLSIDNKRHLKRNKNDQKTKKVRLFSAKEFSKELHNENKSAALTKFLELINSNLTDSQDVIHEYLEYGETCLELLQILDTDSTIPPTIILEIVHYILLRISANFPRYISSAKESCRYLLNSHVSMINKMLNLSSSAKERKVILELLTTVIMISSGFAKDIILHVNFNPTNLELLTKHSNEQDSVRNAFIHFLIAFLVDGQFSTLSVLLEKRELLTSIVHGLQYDFANTVCFVLTAFKNHILENPIVSKTLKMKTFSTPVVRDIVNLYNWKGPEGYNLDKKKTFVYVDESVKSKVNEAVHSFLLVLCTSHKYGVIFKDPLLGLGKKNVNSLMYTVLESLERPWEHSYASELVSGICGACPDLVKTMWSNLKQFLEPRLTVRWLNAVNFSKQLLHEVKPENIEIFAKELSVTQLAQLIQCFVTPTVVLKVIVTEAFKYEKHSIKHTVLLLLVDMLKSVNNYISVAHRWLSNDNYNTLKKLLADHIARNLPNVENVLNDWNKLDEDATELVSYSDIDHLNICIDLFDLYKSLSPQLVDKLTIIIDLPTFLQEIDLTCEGAEDKRNVLKMKLINLYLEFDPTMFSPENELFNLVVLLAFELYYKEKNESARKILYMVFQNTSIFEGCKNEIGIWIDAILDLKHFNEEVPKFIIGSFRLTVNKISHYIKKLSTVSEEIVSLYVKKNSLNEVLDDLIRDDNCTNVKIFVKHSTLSPVVLAALDCLDEIDANKSIKIYFNFLLLNLLHLQTNPRMLINIVTNQNSKCIYDSTLRYISSWAENYSYLEKNKGKIDTLQQFSSAILNDDMDSFLKENGCDLFVDEKNNLLQMTMFYLTNLATSDLLTKAHVKSCQKYLQFLFKNNMNIDYLKTILCHPTLLHYFSPLHISQTNAKGLCTEFVLNVLKELPDAKDNIYLDNYCMKLITSLINIFKKPSKSKYIETKSLFELIRLLNITHEQCVEILNFVLKIDQSDLISSENVLSVVFNIIVMVLELFVKLSHSNVVLRPLSQEIIDSLVGHMKYLNRLDFYVDTASFAKNLADYFSYFSHHLENIDSDLFESIVTREEYCKENSLLAAVLLNFQKDKLLPIFEKHIEKICSRKGLILPLLETLIDHNLPTELANEIYKHFKPAVFKALQKPQKAKQHFEKYYKSVAKFLKTIEATDLEKFVEKVQKYDVAEPFHAHLLQVVFEMVVKDSEKLINNAVLTFIHLCLSIFKKKTKTDLEWNKLEEITRIFETFVTKLNVDDCMCKTLSQNESFQLYCKFCLKFGLTNDSIYLKMLTVLCKIVDFSEDDYCMFIEMIISHSEFLEVALSDDNKCKAELFGLILLLCKRCPEVLQRNHMPMLLAAYQGTLRKSDRNILSIIKICETKPSQTGFYDFKPFLWSRAAATHYSVRSDVQKVLWRQPRTGDVFNILQSNWVSSTIKNYPLKLSMKNLDEPLDYSIEDHRCTYDLAFMLPLFSQLLASENAVQTYIFNKSGALSLTITGLSCDDREVRLAACHILARYYYHLEANQRGKDNLLWLRFVEVVCKAVAVTKDLILNNFAVIFLARMATILTQPMHVMYIPLSQYLGAKANLDLSGIPELYTLLHSPDVNCKEHRKFILKIIRDGLRTEKDFEVALHSMAFKLIMELFDSCISDVDSQLVILKIIENSTRFSYGTKLLCSSYGLLAWLYTIVFNLKMYNASVFLPAIINILINILKISEDAKNFTNVMVMIITCIIDKFVTIFTKDKDIVMLLKLILKMFYLKFEFLNEIRLHSLIAVVGDNMCNYMLEFGCEWFKFESDDCIDDKIGYIRKIVFLWCKRNRR